MMEGARDTMEGAFGHFWAFGEIKGALNQLLAAGILVHTTTEEGASLASPTLSPSLTTTSSTLLPAPPLSPVQTP